MDESINIYDNKPEKFFFEDNIIVHNIDIQPGILGLNVGYEETGWRYDEFTDYLFEWLPEFALKYSDIIKMNHANSMRFLKQAAKTVYQTDNYQRRGEFGELMLHAIIREIFNSQPAISKIYYKTATNDTVKGFDAVHIVEVGDKIELWLGEAKFYSNINDAIKEVIEELIQHSKRDYLKEEFILISGKIDDKWSHANQIKKMLSSRNSLDTLFSQICFPVLLTYDSKTVRNNKLTTDKFKKSLDEEINKYYNDFKKNLSLEKPKIHLILLPLEYKQFLMNLLDKKLKGLQI